MTARGLGKGVFNLDTIWNGKHESDVSKSQHCTPNGLATSVTRYYVTFQRVHEMSRNALHIALYLRVVYFRQSRLGDGSFFSGLALGGEQLEKALGGLAQGAIA